MSWRKIKQYQKKFSCPLPPPPWTVNFFKNPHNFPQIYFRAPPPSPTFTSPTTSTNKKRMLIANPHYEKLTFFNEVLYELFNSVYDYLPPYECIKRFRHQNETGLILVCFFPCLFSPSLNRSELIVNVTRNLRRNRSVIINKAADEICLPKRLNS